MSGADIPPVIAERREGGEPGIQLQSPNLPLDSGFAHIVRAPERQELTPCDCR
jgi:hypothetical protein